MADNPITEWLAERYPEASPMGFYRELFPSGSLAPAPARGASEPHRYDRGTYSAVLVRVLAGADGRERAERHLVMDDLANARDVLAVDSALLGTGGHATDLLSPVSYAGRSPRLDMAHELFALAFDLDYVQTQERPDGTSWPVGLEELVYQMTELGRSPMPTYMVSSGTGLHLYYLLDEPLRMWPNVVERLSEFRHSMVDLVWNRYVTREPDRPQYEGVVQAFRMVGSVSKGGDQVVRAFRTGGRWSMGDLNAFVPEASRVPESMFRARHTLEEARALWPEWDPGWRRKAMGPTGPLRRWRVKRALFDWWCRRVEDGRTETEAFEGNRYWCVFVAACLAAKCPEVGYDELEAWAYSARPRLDRLTVNPENRFTEKDVSDALLAYGNPVSVKLRRDKIAEKTSLPMPVNKRNGRNREVHLRIARATKEVLKSADEMKPEGRPAKRDIVLRYASNHPGANHSEIARALGISRPTVIKWMKAWDGERVAEGQD